MEQFEQFAEHRVHVLVSLLAQIGLETLMIQQFCSRTRTISIRLKKNFDTSLRTDDLTRGKTRLTKSTVFGCVVRDRGQSLKTMPEMNCPDFLLVSLLFLFRRIDKLSFYKKLRIESVSTSPMTGCMTIEVDRRFDARSTQHNLKDIPIPLS
jgi:hypothetical protein